VSHYVKRNTELINLRILQHSLYSVIIPSVVRDLFASSQSYSPVWKQVWLQLD